MTQKEFDALPKEKQDALLAEQGGDIQKVLAKDAKNNPAPKQMSMADLKGAIDTCVKSAISKMTNIDKKHFAFPGVIADGDLSPEGKFEKTCKFLKALVKGDVQTLNTLDKEVRTKANLNESTGAEGGYLVPEEFKAEILRLAPKYGIIRQNARIIPMQRDVLNIPSAGTTDLTASWTNEAAQILSTDPNFRQVTLTINKLATIPKVTPELLADANVSVVNYLAELAAEQFGKNEDIQGFKGVGSPFVGLINATGAPTYPHASGTGFETLSYQDLVKIPGFTWTTQLANAKFYFHRTMIAHIRALITTAGAPIFPATTNSIAGYPLVATEILPGIGHTAYQTTATTYALFGDLRKALLMGERGTVEMKMGTEGTVGGDNLFEKDMMALRFIERVCFGVALPSAVVIIQTS